MSAKFIQYIPVKKSPIPILWLDTSVLLHLAKLRAGKNLDSKLCTQVTNLQGEIRQLVRQGKLICPEVEQHSEYARTDSLFLDVFDDLSLGIRAKPPQLVELQNIVRAMEAYASNKPSQHSYLDAFYSDPADVLSRECTQQYRVRAVTAPSQELIDALSQSRAAIANDLERLRKQNLEQKITFDPQRRREIQDSYAVIFRQAQQFLQKVKLGIEPDLKDLNFWDQAHTLLYAWKKIASSHVHKAEMGHFFRSSHFESIPNVDISAKLFAEILTGNSKICSGDQMDIRHISAFLPYANLMIVDKAMRDRVRRLKLDHHYGTKVVYIGDSKDIEMFFDECKKLEDQSIWQISNHLTPPSSSAPVPSPSAGNSGSRDCS